MLALDHILPSYQQSLILEKLNVPHKTPDVNMSRIPRIQRSEEASKVRERTQFQMLWTYRQMARHG